MDKITVGVLAAAFILLLCTFRCLSVYLCTAVEMRYFRGFPYPLSFFSSGKTIIRPLYNQCKNKKIGGTTSEREILTGYHHQKKRAKLSVQSSLLSSFLPFGYFGMGQ